MRPRWGSKPGLTDRLVVGRNVTLTLTFPIHDLLTMRLLDSVCVCWNSPSRLSVFCQFPSVLTDRIVLCCLSAATVPLTCVPGNVALAVKCCRLSLTRRISQETTCNDVTNKQTNKQKYKKKTTCKTDASDWQLRLGLRGGRIAWRFAASLLLTAPRGVMLLLYTAYYQMRFICVA
jgi:hypothetical protein